MKLLIFVLSLSLPQAYPQALQLTTKPDVVLNLILHHSSFNLDPVLFTASISFFFNQPSCMDSHLSASLTWATCFCGMSWKEKTFPSPSRMNFLFLDVFWSIWQSFARSKSLEVTWMILLAGWEGDQRYSDSSFIFQTVSCVVYVMFTLLFDTLGKVFIARTQCSPTPEDPGPGNGAGWARKGHVVI